MYSCDIDGMQCVMKEYVFQKVCVELRRRTQVIYYIHFILYSFSFLQRSSAARGQFEQEIEMIEKLSHPNIVRYLHHTEKRASLRYFFFFFFFPFFHSKFKF